MSTLKQPNTVLDGLPLDVHVHEERLRIVYARTLTPILTGMPFAAFMVWILWPIFPHQILLGWLAVKLLTALIRVWHYVRDLRGLAKRSRPSRPHLYLVLLAIDGVAWGAALTLLSDPNQIAGSALLFACMVGVAAIGTMSLSSYFLANAIFSTVLLLPGALLGLIRGSEIDIFGGVGLIAFLGLLLTDGRRTAQAVTEQLQLRFQFDHLARERAAALESAEHHSAIKSQFLATMSHEMRTPLHGMLGTLRLLQDRIFSPDDLDKLTLIERSGEHLLTIINDVLDFSKIEAGKMQLSDEAFDLTQALHDVTTLCHAAAKQKGISLELMSQLPTPCWVNGDAARVRQIVLNLLGNAIKFTDRGSITLTAEIVDAHLRIAISDTGIGIPKDQLGRIFESFRQVDGSFARRFSGTGLGLAISRELASAMKGDLSCTSEVGIGSVFTFEWPWRPAAAPTSIPAASFAASELPAIPSHVLLVDDNPINLVVAEAMLQKFGIPTVVATNGAEAVDSYRRVRPTLVLMDCHMPVLDGFAATGQIRAIESATGGIRVPVIAATANAFDDERQRCLAAGMDDHVAKPFSEEDLRAALIRNLHQAAA